MAQLNDDAPWPQQARLFTAQIGSSRTQAAKDRHAQLVREIATNLAKVAEMLTEAEELRKRALEAVEWAARMEAGEDLHEFPWGDWG